jgi:hypothetical protein
MDKTAKFGIICLIVIVGLVLVAFANAKPTATAARAVRYSCSDTDGGINLPVQGTVSGYYNKVPYSNTDSCVDSGNVLEYYCTGDYAYNSQNSCGTDGYQGSNYCLSGNIYRNYTDYSCATGACGSSITPMLQQTCQYGCTAGTCNNPPNNCSDTDGGMITAVFGTITGYNSGSWFEYNDSCVSSSIINERYCSGVWAGQRNLNCTINTSCISGACQ